MADNFVNYSNMTALTTKIANKIKNAGQRIFTGTQAEWDALTLAEKQTYVQANITDDESTGGTIFTRTLTAGSTTITISDASITADSMIDIYTNVFGIAPTNIVASAGTVTVTFNAQQNDISVKIVVR